MRVNVSTSIRSSIMPASLPLLRKMSKSDTFDKDKAAICPKYPTPFNCFTPAGTEKCLGQMQQHTHNLQLSLQIWLQAPSCMFHLLISIFLLPTPNYNYQIRLAVINNTFMIHTNIEPGENCNNLQAIDKLGHWAWVLPVYGSAAYTFPPNQSCFHSDFIEGDCDVKG